MVSTKLCTKCKIEKPLDQFSVNKASPTGIRSACKECCNAHKRQWSANNKDHCKQYMDKWREQNKEHVEAYTEKYNEENREILRLRQLLYERNRRQLDPEQARKRAREYYHRTKVLKGRKLKTEEEKRQIAKNYMEEWRKKNAERIKEYSFAYNNNQGIEVRRQWRQKNKHVIFARNALHRSLRLTGRKKASKTENLLGYTYDKLKQRIECQFKAGMSWENYGEWHIDHVKPVTRFIHQGITDPFIVNALCNLRPLWAVENMKKNRFFHAN